MGNEEQVATNFISSLTAAHTNAVARYKDKSGEIDLALEEILYIFPAGTRRTNEYFNRGVSSFFICLFIICLLTKTIFLCTPLWQTAGNSRIDFNDRFELVKYPMVFSKDILDGLSAAGVWTWMELQANPCLKLNQKVMPLKLLLISCSMWPLANQRHCMSASKSPSMGLISSTIFVPTGRQ
jgi:hypothetical protein